jgi:transposase
MARLPDHLPIPPDVFARLPAEFRTVLEAVVDYYERRIAEFEARLNKTPQNSSLPPSSQHPHAKPAAPRQPSGKKPGGQPGHPKHERDLIPIEECSAVVSLKPSACRRCGGTLAGDDAKPLRHQVWELPQIQPHVTEYQLHRLLCPPWFPSGGS